MAPDRWVVVDDADQAINYTGSWVSDTSGSQDNIGNFGPPYLETLHGISTNGSVLFEFNGTAVEVSGTNKVINFNTNPDPTLECFIDNTSIGREPVFQFDENNWNFCGKSGLKDGLHQLRIAVTVQSPNQTFWLDQIRYIPSPTLRLDNRTILMDNMDSAVHFDAQWTALGGTANMTTAQNSVAQVDFVGTSISWFAFIPTELPHGGAQGSWRIDDGSENQFLLQGLPADSKANTVYNQRYFTTPDSQPGPHTLTVTFHGTGQTTPLVLDYLYVKNGSFPTLSSDSPSTSSGVSTVGGSHPQPTGDGRPQGTPVGGILGGVLGGLAFLICIAGALLFWRRRRARPESFYGVRGSDFPAVPYRERVSNIPGGDPHIHGMTPNGLLSPSWSSNPPSTSPVEQPASNLPRKLRNETAHGSSGYHVSNLSHSSQMTTSLSSSRPMPMQTTPNVSSHNTSSIVLLNPHSIEENPPQYSLD